jgi:hypothetical protein
MNDESNGITPAESQRPRWLRFPRHQRMTIINGVLMFVLILVVLQLWLLTATMNAYLGGDDSVVWPAAVASAVCLGLNLGLLWYMRGLER